MSRGRPGCRLAPDLTPDPERGIIRITCPCGLDDAVPLYR